MSKLKLVQLVQYHERQKVDKGHQYYYLFAVSPKTFQSDYDYMLKHTHFIGYSKNEK